MRSNVCKIERGRRCLRDILKESEKVAVYNELNHKQTLQLRLLCEELDGMLPEMLGEFEGDFWISYENGECRIQTEILMEELRPDRKEELLSLAGNKKNAAAVGVVGKIRAALETLFLNVEFAEAFAPPPMGIDASAGYYMGLDSTGCWSLGQYRTAVKSKDHSDAWDELEKSVIATLADDVIVGIKGRQAYITIIKKFA